MTLRRPLAALILLAAPAALADGLLPQGGTATSGAATETYGNGVLTTDQQSQTLIMNYDSIHVGAGNHWDIRQPNADAALLARTGQTDVSRIDGRISAPGNVLILNPNGIAVGPDATIDVNGLALSTGTMEDADFNAGRYRIDNIDANPDAAVINEGRITMREGGWAALVAPRVENHGVIQGKLGRVALGSASAVTVDPRGDGLLQFRAPLTRAPDGAAALVTNKGLIRVEGGAVELSADALEGVIENVVNMDGVVSVSSAAVEGGTVVLSGGRAGVVAVSGKIDARSEGAGDAGGDVVLSGDLIDVKATAEIDASGSAGGGEILIGGDKQGAQAVALGETKANARGVRIEEGARILANALDVGDGGRVIVWSDQVTGFAGAIEARGGAAGGDGGFVEVSGKERLVFRGTADRRAPAGEAGTLLLDPTDIVISNAATDLAAFGPLPLAGPTIASGGAGGTPSIINIGDLRDALVGGNVTITTTSPQVGPTGTITVADDVDLTGLTTDLALTADADIAIDGAITGGGGALTLTAANGSIAFNAAVTTNGGALTASADALAQTITVDAPIAAAAGAVDLSAGADINVNQSIMTTSGAITLTADAAGLGGSVNVSAPVTSASGDVTLQGSNVQLANTIASSGALTLLRTDPAAALTLGGTGGFDLDMSEIANLADGFSKITIGEDIATPAAANTLNVVTVVGDADFTDALEINAFDVTVNAGAQLTSSDGDVALNALSQTSVDGTVEASAGDLTLNTGTLIGTGDVVTSDILTIQNSEVGGQLIVNSGPGGGLRVETNDALFVDANGVGTNNYGSLVLGRADDQTGVIFGASGASTLTGETTIRGGGLNLAGGVTMANGDNLTIEVFDNAGSGGVVQIGAGAPIDGMGGDIVIRGVDMQIDEAVQSAGGALTIEQSNAAPVTVGGTGTFLEDADIANLGTDFGTLTVGAAGQDLTIDNPAFGQDVTFRGDNITVAGGTYNAPANVGVTFNAGSQIAVTTLTTQGGRVQVASGGIVSAGVLSIDTTLGGNPGGANVVLGDINLGAAQDVTVNAGTAGNITLNGAVNAVGQTADFTANNTGGGGALNANVVNFNGANATATNIAANTVNVFTAGATLEGAIGGLTGIDAALSAGLNMPASTAYTFNGFTSAGEAVTADAALMLLEMNDCALTSCFVIDPPEPALPPEVALPSGGEGGAGGGAGGAGAPDAEIDIGGRFDDLDVESLGELSELNDDATLSDDALLGFDSRSGLIAEILGALDRNSLGADGAPTGPYSERTTLIPGVLAYDPNAGETEEVGDVRAPVFGALEGW